MKVKANWFFCTLVQCCLFFWSANLYALSNADTGETISLDKADAKTSNWLPGETEESYSLKIPASVKSGDSYYLDLQLRKATTGELVELGFGTQHRSANGYYYLETYTVR